MAKIPVPAVMGFYDDPKDLLYVCDKAVHQEKFKGVDSYSPFPIHGMEDALSLKRSWVSTIARFGLIIGAALGFILQAWTSAVDWPTNIGGKPFVSWPAFVPVAFEAGVLLAGFCNLLALFAACNLFPRPKTIVLSRRITNDRFVVVIPVNSKEMEDQAIQFLQEHKALKLKIIDGIDEKNQRVVFRAAPITEEPLPA